MCRLPIILVNLTDASRIVRVGGFGGVDGLVNYLCVEDWISSQFLTETCL